jgi:hypothetical protein
MDKTPWQLFKEKTAGDPARPWDFINPKTIYVKNEVKLPTKNEREGIKT